MCEFKNHPMAVPVIWLGIFTVMAVMAGFSAQYSFEVFFK